MKSSFSAALFAMALLSCSPSVEDTSIPNLADAEREVIDLIQQSRLDVAEAKIDDMIRTSPNDPRPMMLKTILHYSARYYSPQGINRDSLKAMLIDDCRRLAAIAEKMPPSTAQKFYLGSAYSYWSRADIMNQSFTDAYFHARRGLKLLEEVIEENPAFADAYIHVGIVKYFVATRANWWQTALAWMSGLSGSTEEALSHFHRTMNDGALNQYEAAFALGMVYRFFENDLDKANEIFTQFNSRYPDNAFMTNQQRNVAALKLIADKGVQYLTENFDTIRTIYDIRDSGFLNQLGYTYAGRQEFENALAIFQLNLRLFPEVANCYDSLAECYYNMGNKSESLKYYRMALEKLPADATITEDFRQRLEQGIKDKLKELES